MTLKDAIGIVKSEIGKNVEGYWVVDDGFVFKISGADADKCEPGLYAVDSDGTCYGTNPLNVDINIDTMLRI